MCISANNTKYIYTHTVKLLSRITVWITVINDINTWTWLLDYICTDCILNLTNILSINVYVCLYVYVCMLQYVIMYEY